MRLWLLTVLVLFALAQVFQWVKSAILPLPIYVLAGAFLAIASNYDKGLGTLLSHPTPVDPSIQTATLIEDPQLPDSPDQLPR
jgi:hypothetical protein